MRLLRLGCLAVLIAIVTGSASASTIRMAGGSGSEPFTTLTFNVVLNATGNNCDPEINPDCFFQNETGKTITEIDFVFNNPPTLGAGCENAPNSPFLDCTVDQSAAKDVFRFYDGSLPNGAEFGLTFPTAFPPNTTLGAIAIPSSTPEPGSGALLLTCLGGMLIVWRGRRAVTRSGA
jgi:hypothetical protein